ncbi:MAG: Flp family type IVb pilin [Deltaproteobacteria bacterium]|nr:Flp family type IVb pilin [Deltaproteobacteria bacterium]
MDKKTRQRGQSLVEYVALTALVAIVSIGTVKVFGGKVRTRLDQITKTFDKNVQQGLHGHRSSAADDEDDEGGGWPGGVKLPGGMKLPRGIPFPF